MTVVANERRDNATQKKVREDASMKALAVSRRGRSGRGTELS
jgi:hypothetical protein